MQKSYTALKLRTRGLNAGTGERHGAELLADIVAVCLVLSDARRRECNHENNKNGAAVFHRGLHSCESLFVWQADVNERNMRNMRQMDGALQIDGTWISETP
jgi:hypothetical protein